MPGQAYSNARVTLKANLTGVDKTYTSDFVSPDLDGDNPELERLWALAFIEKIDAMERIGAIFVANTNTNMTPVPLAHLVGGVIGFVVGLPWVQIQ